MNVTLNNAPLWKPHLKLGLVALALSGAMTLSGCSDDDDDDDHTLVSKSVGYNAFIPAFPEGLAYDSSREAFLVSSASTGAVGQVDKAGNYTALIAPAAFAGNGSFGIAVDQTNNRLHVVSSNLQDPTYGHLLIFNLSDMTLLHNVDLAALSGGGLSFVNDVAVDANGNAYVTNSDKGIIYKVDMAGNASIFLQDASLAPGDAAAETGLNGIAYHPDGFLVAAHFIGSKLYKISMDATPVVSEISLPGGRIHEPDGIEINGKYLYAVNAGGTAPFVSRFSMSDDWLSGTNSGDTFPTGSTFPTTLAKNDDGIFVNHSYFNFPAYGNNPTQYLISEVYADQNLRFRGTASEIPRFHTPVMPLGYGSNYPDAFLADCTDDLAMGVPDLRGDWVEATVTIDGTTHNAATENPHSERIEQCGERLIVISSGVVHDIYKADGTMYNGVNDVNPQGQPIQSTGVFTADSLVLTAVLPVSLNMSLPDVTRQLMTDNSGQSVLRFFNAGLGRVVYMVR